MALATPDTFSTDCTAATSWATPVGWQRIGTIWVRVRAQF